MFLEDKLIRYNIYTARMLVRCDKDGKLYLYDWIRTKKKRAARLNNNMLHGNKLRFLKLILYLYLKNVNIFSNKNIAIIMLKKEKWYKANNKHFAEYPFK